MGRRIRTTLPMLSKNLEPAWPDLEKVRECDNKAKESYSYHYNRRHGTRPLSELHPGDNVMTKLDDQKGWKPATVVSQASTPRSYLIQTETQRLLRRNRKHLQDVPRPLIPEQDPPSESDMTESPTRILDPTHPPEITPASPQVLPRQKSVRQHKPPDKYGDWTT